MTALRFILPVSVAQSESFYPIKSLTSIDTLFPPTWKGSFLYYAQVQIKNMWTYKCTVIFIQFYELNAIYNNKFNFYAELEYSGVRVSYCTIKRAKNLVSPVVDLAKASSSKQRFWVQILMASFWKQFWKHFCNLLRNNNISLICLHRYLTYI